MNFKSFLSLLLLLSPIPVSANGVERGSIREAILGSEKEIQEDLLDLVTEAVTTNCNLKSSRIISTKVTKSVEYLDQGVRDYYYNILFTVALEDGSGQETISILAAKYAISNPSVPNKEILSISSNLCRKP